MSGRYSQCGRKRGSCDVRMGRIKQSYLWVKRSIEAFSLEVPWVLLKDP